VTRDGPLGIAWHTPGAAITAKHRTRALAVTWSLRAKTAADVRRRRYARPCGRRKLEYASTPEPAWHGVARSTNDRPRGAWTRGCKQREWPAAGQTGLRWTRSEQGLVGRAWSSRAPAREHSAR